MPVDLSETLVVGISSSALFDLEEADRVWREQGVAAYRTYMLDREDESLAPGTAMPLVKALLELKARTPDNEAPYAEVVVMSRNSPETGIRVLHTIRHLGLGITRFAFTGGEDLAPYVPAFGVDLFLSRNKRDVEAVIDAGVAAAALLYPPPDSFEPPQKQLRIAFDADAVLVSDESEAIYKAQGLVAFLASEDARRQEALNDGPHANLLRKLARLQQRLPDRVEYSPVRVAIVTARNAPAELRLLNTLRRWEVYVDSTFFMGGLSKGPVLRALRPHIYFDDQEGHLADAAKVVPSGRVPYRAGSSLGAPLPDEPLDTSEVLLSRSPADQDELT